MRMVLADEARAEAAVFYPASDFSIDRGQRLQLPRRLVQDGEPPELVSLVKHLLHGPFLVRVGLEEVPHLPRVLAGGDTLGSSEDAF